MADNFPTLDERPYHKAFLADKLPCPHKDCHDNFSCFVQDGLDHHYRTIHKCSVTTADIEKSKNLMVEKHSEETLSCLRKLSINNKSKVFVIYKINIEY
jgi:hypothetical protein